MWKTERGISTECRLYGSQSLDTPTAEVKASFKWFEREAWEVELAEILRGASPVSSPELI